MENHLEIVLLGTQCYENKAYVLFPKTNFEYSWAENLSDYVFFAILFTLVFYLNVFGPYPFKRTTLIQISLLLYQIIRSRREKLHKIHDIYT